MKITKATATKVIEVINARYTEEDIVNLITNDLLNQTLLKKIVVVSFGGFTISNINTLIYP